MRCPIQRNITRGPGEWLNTIYGFIYDGSRVILIGSVLKCSDRSRPLRALSRIIPGAGCLNISTIYRAPRTAVISFHRIIHPTDVSYYMYAISRSPPPPRSRSAPGVAPNSILEKDLFGSLANARFVSPDTRERGRERERSRARSSESENPLNPHVDFSLCHR